MTASKRRVWVIAGTRPEVIKQVPVYWALKKRTSLETRFITTGQHRELLDQALSHFSVRADDDFAVMVAGANLTELSSRILQTFSTRITADRPDLVLVQGDTISAAMIAWSCFLEKIPVVHNEAGLRSFDLMQPFPEEACRKLISIAATDHYAPTERAAEVLRREGVAPKSVHVVGNTVVDALLWTLEQKCSSTFVEKMKTRSKHGSDLILVTAHRRENAASMDAWYRTLASFIAEHEKAEIICPIHPNNLARAAAEKHLTNQSRVHLVSPLSYLETTHLLAECRAVVTDSGGIQEEGATLGIPVVVCRKRTERMEGVDAGLARLCDPDQPQEVRSAMEWAYAKTVLPEQERPWPFGRGGSGEEIARRMEALLASRPSHE